MAGTKDKGHAGPSIPTKNILHPPSFQEIIQESFTKLGGGEDGLSREAILKFIKDKLPSVLTDHLDDKLIEEKTILMDDERNVYFLTRNTSHAGKRLSDTRSPSPPMSTHDQLLGGGSAGGELADSETDESSTGGGELPIIEEETESSTDSEMTETDESSGGGGELPIGQATEILIDSEFDQSSSDDGELPMEQETEK